MEPNTITSEHFHGWRLKTNFSTASLEWLLWEEQKLGRCLQPAGNQGEYRIPYGRYAVGGYDSEDNIVCEFQGLLDMMRKAPCQRSPMFKRGPADFRSWSWHFYI
ncbi:hypothetical protein pdam_00000481 [Pocillopora damicornis]|uniref:Uncharacterized protein n=1 Tax=Pocillopora damicornis TaxID=46731 RepID=A0A3M6UJB5_POCDA|nr:hypothetical protein pdam_00000481 [Pocillopora damicornis]